MVRGIIHPETGVNRMVSESSLPAAGKSATRRSDSATSAFAGASWNCARVTGYSSLNGLGKSCRQSIRNLPVRLAGLAVPKANRLVEMDDRGGTSVQQEITTFVRLGCHYPSTAALTIGSIHHNGRILFTTRFSVPSFEVKAVRTPRACFLVRPQSPNLGC